MTKEEMTLGMAVRLAIGSPRMVVTRLPDERNPDTVECLWFEDGEAKRPSLPCVALVPADLPAMAPT